MKTYGQEEQIEDLLAESPLEEQALLSEVSPSLPQIEAQYIQIFSDLTDRIAGFAPSLRSVFYAGMLAVALSLPYSAVYAEGPAMPEAPIGESAAAVPNNSVEYVELPEVEDYFLNVNEAGFYTVDRASDIKDLTEDDKLIIEGSKSVLPVLFGGEVGTINVLGSQQIAPNLYSHTATGPAHAYEGIYDRYTSGENRNRNPIKIAIQGVDKFYPADVEFGLNSEPIATDVNDEARITFVTNYPIDISNTEKSFVTRREISENPDIFDLPIYVSGYPIAANEFPHPEGAITKLIVKTHVTSIEIGEDGQIKNVRLFYPETLTDGMSGGDASVVINGKQYSIATFKGYFPGTGEGLIVPHEDIYTESNVENPAVPDSTYINDAETSFMDDGVISFEDLRLRVWNSADASDFVEATKLLNQIFELNPNEIRSEDGRIVIVTSVKGTDLTRTFTVSTDTFKLEPLS